ncbi:MAG: tetratricopeptide repeat protein [Planctomycetota bacterium]|nr:tetratricopeptide repeat protein [Planctomycetota bacterium]MDA1177297.1 tetratricopeptide repeat protein [Planctomycetota bacterium]
MDSTTSAEPSELLLQGKTLALTGRFASMTQESVAQLVRKFGGQVVQQPSRRTHLLITGQEGWPLGPDGQPTVSFQRARRLQAEGYSIEIMNEEAFLTHIGLLDQQSAIHRRYTLVQLSRILNVPRTRLRNWIRIGLIEPVETVHRLAYFDYQQVSSARMLEQLVADGLTPEVIRSGLERLRRWLPNIDQPLMQLATLESDGALIVRLQNGSLAESTGQLLLDFGPVPTETDNSPQLFLPEDPESADDAFEEALRFEEMGDLESAADSYADAIRYEPQDPILHFNLGNVVYMLGDLPAAVQHFQAAAQLDELYVEAWNNLGSVLCEKGDHASAVNAFERALQVVPEYADAHYNLADTLQRLDRNAEAQSHWKAYLKLDPTSTWADEVRERLRQPSHP